MSDTNDGGLPGEILNMAQFEEASGGDRELMLELADLYMTDTESNLQHLRDAVSAREAEQFGRVAHGLKGSSASIGADQAAEAFRRLEVKGRTGDLAGLDDALALARAAYERTREHLRALAA